jgi:hypothetical protein
MRVFARRDRPTPVPSSDPARDPRRLALQLPARQAARLARSAGPHRRRAPGPRPGQVPEEGSVPGNDTGIGHFQSQKMAINSAAGRIC